MISQEKYILQRQQDRSRYEQMRHRAEPHFHPSRLGVDAQLPSFGVISGKDIYSYLSTCAQLAKIAAEKLSSNALF